MEENLEVLQRLRGYRSRRGLAVAIVVVLACLELFELLGLPQSLFGGAADGVLANLATFCGVFALLCRMALWVLYLVWLFGSFQNLRPLGSTRVSTMSPGWAIGGWFIPLYSCYHGYAAARQLWIESQPSPSLRTPLIIWWWFAYLFMGLFALITVCLVVTGGIRSGWMVLDFLVSAGTALLFALVVWRTQRRQDDQHDDLLRRASMPRPTPDRFG